VVRYHGFHAVVTERFTDGRGTLTVMEHETRHVFTASRTFLIQFADDAVRAAHVTSCSEILVTLRGAVRIEVDNGEGPHAQTARPEDGAFFVAAGAWRRLVALEPGSQMLVLTDAPYAATYHPDEIVPGMIDEAVRRYPE